MIIIPHELQVQFVTCLRSKAVPEHEFSSYLKWLRYYLDFCEKYRFSAGQPTSLLQFIRKLQEKKQTEAQQQQARCTVTLYHELLQQEESHQPVSAAQPKVTHGSNPTEVRQPHISAHPQPMAPINDTLASHAPTGSLC